MNEQVLSILSPARRSRIFETDKSFRFLFPGGTAAAAGADATFEAFRRAFGAADDVALIVVDAGLGAGAEDRLDWLAASFAAEDSPEVEYLPAAVSAARLPRLLRDVDALVYPWAGQPDQALLRLAIAAELPLIVPEDALALDLLGHDAAYLVPVRPVTVAAGDGRLNRVDPQDLAGVLRQVIAEPDHARDRALRARRRLEGRPEPDPGIDFAICWAGAALDFSGYAKTTRNMLPALLRLGVDASFQAFYPEQKFLDSMARQPEMIRSWRQILERSPRGGLQIVFHPPFRQNGVSFMAHMRCNNPDFEAQVAYTMFETDRIPRGWSEQLNLMDEVWVPTAFNVETFARSGVERGKLKVVPLGFEPDAFLRPARVYPLPGRRSFNFLSIFDWTLRKGWDVLIDAYLGAFTAADDVSLTIRAYQAIKEQAPIRSQIEDRMRLLGIDPKQAPKIILIDDFVSDDDMPSLYAAADAFVLPTRGEGWGMPLIEAMAAGLPTVASRWSAHLEFMNDDNSWLIDVPELGPVDPEQTRVNAFYEADHLWAEPDRDDLARIMRELVADPAAARAKAARGQEEVRAGYSADRVAEILRDRAADLVGRIRAERARRDAEPPPITEAPNIAWTGPVYDKSGYADEGRNYVLGLLDEKVPIRLFPVLWAEEHADVSAVDKERMIAAEEGPFVPGRPVVLIQHALGLVAQPHPRADLSVIRTMFETDGLPADWLEPMLAMDAVFVPSEFNRRTFIEAGVPAEMIEVVPPSIDVEAYRAEPQPIDLGTTRSYRFLSVFDWTRRKGWEFLLRAYVEEFGADEDVCLVLKVWSSFKRSSDQIAAEIESFIRDELGRDPGSCPDITILDRDIPSREMPNLYAAADCYLQPSRGEGWGRPIMEAMAAGLPVVATGWSGNTEFMRRSTSFLLEFGVEPCGPEAVREAAWFAGQSWARPHVPHLRHLMRGLFKDRAMAREVGARGRQEILARFDRPRVNRLLLAAVERQLRRKAENGRNSSQSSRPS
ncbi:MAG: glycosyltransferase [Planctomycetes bacterium]|nr:glycosyltransferase [Planctomycetota bacterium]